jgi:hypothetical protein
MESVRFGFKEDLDWNEWLNLYPVGCHGREEWLLQKHENGHWNFPKLPRPVDLLRRVANQAVGSPRPRAFVSHRHGDEKYAERIAHLADQAGFFYWLDVVNLPPPGEIATMSALSIALRIEMALLNCSHVVAVYTDATAGSTWVPYEYGRVKEPVLSSTKCCTWLYVRNANTTTPEWLELNEKREHDQPLAQWFDDEFRKWGGNLHKPVGYWTVKTIPLP